MKNFLKILVCVFAATTMILLSSCADKVGNELEKYSNNDVQDFNEVFEDATNKFNDAVEDYDEEQLTDEEFIALLDEIIPPSEKLVEDMKDIKFETDEVKKLNDIAIELAETRVEAYKMLKEMFETGNFDNYEDYEETLEKSEKLIAEFDKYQNELADEHGMIVEER